MLKADIRLFIEDREVEFSTDPKILLNYKETELHNPTIVKNSFTKQIQIEGTNNNNEIFGHIWKFDRNQYYGDNSVGPNFNPIRKAPFKLFVNGELFQRGYVKLNSVEMSNNSITYSITLYGGLGDFFYNLSYDESDELNNKKTLADIAYGIDGDMPEPELGFYINKEAVADAWGLGSFNDRWNVINFIPCYNGIPSDFDANKVMINNYQQNRNIFQIVAQQDGKPFTPMLNGTTSPNGYSLGEMEDDLTEWETFDLRSYLQRPALSMYRLIEACRLPENNGGYKVELDSHFFDLNNPYYRDAWVTLPMLKDLTSESSESSEEIVDATLVKSGNTGYMVEYETSSLSSINNVRLKLGINFTPSTTTSATDLYSSREYQTRPTFTLQGSKFVKKYLYNSGVIVQLEAYDIGNNRVASSKAYLLATEKNFPNSKTPLWDKFGDAPSFEFIQGHWKRNGNTYDFVDNTGNIVGLDFSFSTSSNFTTLRLKVMQPEGYYIKYVFTGKESYTSNNASTIDLYAYKSHYDQGNKRKGPVMEMDRVSGSFSFNINSFEAVATAYESMFSNTYISKHQILSSDSTPAEYLISFCKLFGLYFYYDSTEEAEDTGRYPSGVIHIMDRDTFYNDEVVDLTDLVDYSRKMEITPSTAEAKWYRFDLEHLDSEANNSYKANYDYNYGRQLVNTSYNFDANTIDLYDGSIFKAGEMVMEKDKYYKEPVENIPPYTFNGMTYKLFHKSEDDEGYDEYEIQQEVSSTSYWHNLNSYDFDYYDRFPKLQCHSKNNDGVDGNGVLMFRFGSIVTQGAHSMFNYWLTDDIKDMVLLNDATPCWIMTNSEYNGLGERIAIKVQELPYYTRDIVLNSGQQIGNIVHSWNFGHPQVTFVPQTYTTEGDSIYDKWWKNYLKDLYDVNSRKLTCYVKVNLDGKPWPYWLRRFYWFQNSLWRLNEIKDLNMSSFEPTQLTFIKVNDMENYKLEKVDMGGRFEIILDENIIGYEGGTITGRVLTQSNDRWFVADSIPATDTQGNRRYYDSTEIMNPTSGGGLVTPFTLTIPENTGDYPLEWKIGIEDSFDQWHFATFTQMNNGQGFITITPNTQTIRYTTTSTTYTIETININGNLSIADSADWLTVEKNGNTLIATTTVNNSETVRRATISVTGTDMNGNTVNAEATLTQNGIGLDLDKSTLIFNYNDQYVKSVEVITDTDWTLTSEDNE